MSQSLLSTSKTEEPHHLMIRTETQLYQREEPEAIPKQPEEHHKDNQSQVNQPNKFQEEILESNPLLNKGDEHHQWLMMSKATNEYNYKYYNMQNFHLYIG